MDSLALARSMPAGTARNITLAIAYVIVVLLIVVQELTIKSLVSKATQAEQA